MIINFINRQDALLFDPLSLDPLVEQVIHHEGQSCDEVSIYFIGNEEMCRLHEQFFQDPSPTDCISFPMDEEDDCLPYRVLGDVFVCPETALKYAQEHQVDPFEETTLYIVHGLLHLMGYDDIEEEDRLEMRQAEARHMHALKKLGLSLKPSIN